MQFYVYYAQTPELRSLSTPAERDSVHAQVWRELRRRRPVLWVRSFLVVVLCTFIGTVVAEMLLGPFAITAGKSFRLGAAIGGGIGVLLHIHMMASELRPVYSEVIARRQQVES